VIFNITGLLPKNHTFISKNRFPSRKIKPNKSESFEFKKDAQLFETENNISARKCFKVKQGK